MNPAVVVSAYNRPAAITRLLGSLSAADYPAGAPIPLVISIDHAGEQPEVRRIAEDFHWPYGPKQVICHEEHLGPVRHFYACGDLSAQYGRIIFLEDDLFVSPVFYHYARQALDAFEDDPSIGGLSLYALWFNGYNQLPFIPHPDGADVFFLQVPYTQGMAFTADQWQGFASWDTAGLSSGLAFPPIHESWTRFRSDEWFPHMARYLVANQRFFAFPRVSLTTGFGDAGTHFARPSVFFQTPLQYAKTRFDFNELQESTAVYDSFFEILPDRLDRLSPLFRGQEYSVDLYASRTAANMRAPYVLTTRPCRQAVSSYSRSMLPHEANLFHPNPGNEISFCRLEDLRWDWLADQEIKINNSRYFSHGKGISISEAVKHAVLKSIGRLNL